MKDEPVTDIHDNLSAIDEKIARTCRYAGVEPTNPKLIAVSKRQPIERIEAALQAGHRVFGENRIQEAQSRWPSLREQYDGVELHLIGSLQTNKAADAVAMFDVIQVIDREKLATKLATEMEKQGRDLPVYIQVNTGSEPQKGGVMPDELDELVKLVRDTLKMKLVGLMCIPPSEDDPTLHFGFLSKLAGKHGLPKLSMGMSADYDLAAAMGATDIRVGTAIFGARDS